MGRRSVVHHREEVEVVGVSCGGFGVVVLLGIWFLELLHEINWILVDNSCRSIGLISEGLKVEYLYLYLYVMIIYIR